MADLNSAQTISEQTRLEADRRAPHRIELSKLFILLNASATGLTEAQAQQRLQQYGFNEPRRAPRATALAQFLHFCSNPLVLILLVASSISALLGELVNSAIIGTMVVLSVMINFFQAYRSEQAIRRLRERIAPSALVLRDGEWREIARRELVPGDVVRLSAGDLAPGDARLMRSRDLHVQQAALTGESMPSEKAATQSSSASNLLEAENCLFLGTSVVSGSATAVIFATGPRTQFGDIALRLAARPPETEFDRGVRQFGLLIMKTVVFLVLFILAVNLALHRDALESLLFAVALAVGLTPEFLPMITTVTLSAGAVRMARKKVIVKHLDAIQNFGSVDVLCTDKTGTITTGEMSLEAALDPFGQPGIKAFALGYVNSKFETGIKSPLDKAVLRQPAPDDTDRYQKVDEIPFDFERRRVSITVRKNGETALITKGAPESILAISSTYELNNEVCALDDQIRRRCELAYQRLSAQGLRVLAVAYRSGVV